MHCTSLQIRRETRKHNIHGPVLDGVLNYTEGDQYIHKANFDKHCKAGSHHDWAKKTKSKEKDKINQRKVNKQRQIQPKITTRD